VTVTIDACVWLAALSPAEPSHAACAEFVRTVVQRQVALQQPTLFVVEVCATVARRTGDAPLAAAVGDALLSAPRLALHPLDPERSADAASVASTCALRGADAVYVATARAAGATLVTLDREVLTRAASVVSVVTPKSWLRDATPSA
jgi:predicted nucleic acid-binding protein